MPILQTGIVAGTTGHIGDHNQIHAKLNNYPNVVRDYGAVGDNVTNNTTVLQAAITATANAAATQGRAGTLVFPPGIYKTDALTITGNVHLLGIGQPGRNDAKYGAFLSARANGQNLIVSDPGSITHLGFLIENMGFANTTFTGVTGVRVYGANYWQLIDCVFLGGSGTPMAIGLYCSMFSSTATSLDCNGWDVSRTMFRRCQIGMDIGGNGGRVTNCNFFSEPTQTAETHIRLRRTSSPDETGQNNQIYGCLFDQSPTASVAVLHQGLANNVTNCKFEGRHNLDCAIKAEKVGALANSGQELTLLANIISSCDGVGSAGVKILTGGVDNGIFMNHFNLCNTPNISDAGTRTQNFHNRLSNATWT